MKKELQEIEDEQDMTNARRYFAKKPVRRREADEVLLLDESQDEEQSPV